MRSIDSPTSQPATSDARPFSRAKTSNNEALARTVANEAHADVRTVRRELAFPGSVRGLVGQRIRAAVAARSASATTPKTSAA